MYDGRFVHGIGNTAIFVRKGRVCVYYASIGGKMNLEAAQSSLQVITSLPVIQKVELFEGQNLVIPTGKLYSIQAAEASTVVISRFFCGLTIRRQISSYRQLYVSNVGFGAVREAQQTDDQQPAADQAATRVVTDSLGREVEIPAEVERIAASGPVAQQVLLTVAPEKMVGLSGELTDEQLTYLGEDLADLPVFGQIYGGKGDFNKEAVAAADPQLIIDVGEAKDSLAEELDALQDQIGIPCVHIDSTDLHSYADLYDQLADILDSEKAAELADYCRNAVAEVEAVVAEVPEGGVPARRHRHQCDGARRLPVRHHRPVLRERRRGGRPVVQRQGQRDRPRADRTLGPRAHRLRGRLDL